MPLLTELQKHQTAIVGLNPLDQVVTLNLAGWRRKIGHLPIWKETIARAQFNGWIQPNLQTMSLSRQNLIDEVNNETALDVRFLLDMLWGYGSGKGRAHATVLKMLSDSGLGCHLSKGQSAIADGCFQTAFDAYSKVSGLGMSFVSKLFYFESRAIHPTTYLPIFDNRVAAKLFRLSLNSADQWLCNALSYGRGNDWASYASYAQNLRVLAQSLNPPVTLEQLEYWLFL